MSLSRNQKRILIAIGELHDVVHDYGAESLDRPDLSGTELPDLCDADTPSDPDNLELVLCYLIARLTYLQAYIECAASVNPVTCANAACDAYHAATAACESEHA